MKDLPLWLQVLGPITTIFASLTAGVIAIVLGRAQIRVNEGQREIAAAQRDIAASQRDIAKMRVRMDLLKDRLKISRATFDLMKGCLSGMTANSSDFEKLRRSVRQHPFFFSTEVSSVVDMIDTDCVSLAVQHQARNPYSPGSSELQEAERKVARHLDRWPAPFEQIMAFKDVE